VPIGYKRFAPSGYSHNLKTKSSQRFDFAHRPELAEGQMKQIKKPKMTSFVADALVRNHECFRHGRGVRDEQKKTIDHKLTPLKWLGTGQMGYLLQQH